MQQTEPPALVEVRHVSQHYGTGEKRFTALAYINLTIREGEFVALLGPSGCGKSTLLRIIAGLTRPSEGQVFYRGRPIDGVNPHATIVFQSFALFPWLTVQENVEVAMQARGVPTDERAARAIKLIDTVGLDGFERAYPRELSGGMRQKVGFARALAVDPELLCLDEPFSALDVLSAETLRGELLELWTGGPISTRAILMVSHNIEDAVLMADRLVVMDKGPGRIIAEVPVTLPHPRNRKAPEYIDLVDHVYALLMGQTQPEQLEFGTEPGQPGVTRALPHTSITALSGLLEHVNDAQDQQVDLYQLRDDLRLDLNELIPAVEAAELLGFATVEAGDLALTALGETFAEASILARKEIFATRIRRLPLFQWMVRMLQASGSGWLSWDVFLAALEMDYPPDEVEHQLDTALDWGRYAELFDYDDAKGRVYLEQAEQVAVEGSES